MESLVSSAGSDYDSIGYSSCSSEIVSVTTNSESASSSTGGEARSNSPVKVLEKFDNIAKEDRVHSSLDDLFSNLIIKIGKFYFFILSFLAQRLEK